MLPRPCDQTLDGLVGDPLPLRIELGPDLVALTLHRFDGASELGRALAFRRALVRDALVLGGEALSLKRELVVQPLDLALVLEDALLQCRVVGEPDFQLAALRKEFELADSFALDALRELRLQLGDPFSKFPLSTCEGRA
jgi:hypothetical protein